MESGHSDFLLTQMLSHPINYSTTTEAVAAAQSLSSNGDMASIPQILCGSHFLGRALHDQGHEVRLMPAQYVKPFVQTNKSDYIDSEAIAEAVQRPRMRFV